MTQVVFPPGWPRLQCQRCRHAWVTRLTDRLPKWCPDCGSENWQTSPDPVTCPECGHTWVRRGKRKSQGEAEVQA